MADNSNIIVGIHNYCDRWCERCQFTSRCAVSAAEQADPDTDLIDRDLNNAAFWKKLSSIFHETHEMIVDWAKENGVDLSEDPLAASEELLETQRTFVRNHPVAKAAEKYSFDVKDWFDHQSPQTQMGDDLALQGNACDEIGESVNVILWYQFFIPVKLMRALMSRRDEDEDLDEENPRDSDGSAKVALMAIERSISAWKLMHDLRPESAGTIRGLLYQLEKLRTQTEKEFPEARDFIRPGFDELSLDIVH